MAKSPAPKRLGSLADVRLTAKGMASLLGMKTTWFHNLVRDGIIPKQSAGTYDPTLCANAYIAHLKEARETAEVTKPSSLDDLRQLKAKEMEVKLALRDREIIELEEAMSAVDEIVGLFNSYLSGLPAEMSRNVQERQRIDEIIQEGKQRLSDRFEEVAGTLATGKSTAKAASEDDAD